MVTYLRKKGGAKVPPAPPSKKLGSSPGTLEPEDDDPYEFNIDLTGGALPSGTALVSGHCGAITDS